MLGIDAFYLKFAISLVLKLHSLKLFHCISGSIGFTAPHLIDKLYSKCSVCLLHFIKSSFEIIFITIYTAALYLGYLILGQLLHITYYIQ